MDERKNEKELPFVEVIERLFGEEPVSIPLLFRLSDLSEEDFQLFQARWPLVTVERRGQITRHLSDLMEENFIVDFTPLFSFFLHDAAGVVRAAALDGLWDTTNVALVGPVLEMLHADGETAVRAAAAANLAHYVLLSEWGQLPPSVSQRIVPQLIAVYEQAETETAVKRAALEAMSPASHPRIAELIEDAYESTDSLMQQSAIFAMGNSADLRWLSTVLHELESPYADMRSEAARAAGSLGSSDAVPALAELALDEDDEVALAAIVALGQIGGAEPERILNELLQDEEFEALHEAIEEALEGMMWLAGDFELLALDDDETDFDEDDMGIFSRN